MLKYALLLAKASKWEGEAIDKLKKLVMVVSEVNGFAWLVEELEVDKRKAEAALEASNFIAAKLDHRVAKLEGVIGKAKWQARCYG